MVDTAMEIKKARKEWDTLLWQKAILQVLKRQGYDPEYVKKLEKSFASSREHFLNKYGHLMEWI